MYAPHFYKHLSHLSKFNLPLWIISAHFFELHNQSLRFSQWLGRPQEDLGEDVKASAHSAPRRRERLGRRWVPGLVNIEITDGKITTFNGKTMGKW
jgi:hypothetical protein